MKKLTIALCLLMLGAGMGKAQAHEGEHSLNYSVYQNYRHFGVVNSGRVLKTQQMVKSLLPGWNATTDKLSGMFTDAYGPAAMVPGSNNLQKAQYFMSSKLANMGVNAADWKLTRDINAGHAGYVDFSQEQAGHKVVFSKLSFRFTTDGRLQRVKMQNYGSIEPDMIPTLTANDVVTGTEITSGLAGFSINKKEIVGDWVWFPIPTATGYIMHPAWEFHVTGNGENEMPFDLTGYIDAITGDLLYRSNSVNETFDVTVLGSIHMATPVSPTSEVPMSDMMVTIGSNNYTTDANGFVSIPSVNAPVTVTYPVRGSWAHVRENGNTVSFSANMTNASDTFRLPIQDTTTKEFRAVSAFYHVNKVHDYMKSHWPTFTGMDNPLSTNIDITTSPECNAFYRNDNYSINFYPPQASCRAFSMVSDIVYHEYGHGISYRFYTANGANFQNGAMGEANSDVWAMCINRDGVVGDGAFWSGGNIRSYLGTPKVYPADIRNQVHNDGEILAGSWWDVAVNTGSVDTMAKLFALTHYDVPNGPSGTEGEIYHDVLISALMNDDDDANLGNGTPHFSAIVTAFARHGILLLSDATIEHKEVPHQTASAPVTITGNLTLTNPAFFDKLYLHYRNRDAGGTWDSVAMINTMGNEYSAQIPAYPTGAIVDYYFKAQDIINASSFGLPSGYNPGIVTSEVTIPYQFGVGLYLQRYRFDFEGSLDGWQIGAVGDGATAGKWVQEVPVSTTSGGLLIQPGNDNTTGTGKCLVTGNAAAGAGPDVNDVDNGKTTVITPVFELPFHEPVVEYYRWYSNDRGSNRNLRNDFWAVEIKASTSLFWARVDYTKQSDQRWRRRVFKVSEFLPGATAVQLRFTVEDLINTNLSQSGQNVIEAAIDDFIIYDGTPLSVDNVGINLKADIYPNPADDVVNIALPKGSKGSITMYDLTGKTISKVDVTDATEKYSISTANLAPGTYMLLMQTQYAVQNTKVVVNHK